HLLGRSDPARAGRHAGADVQSPSRLGAAAASRGRRAGAYGAVARETGVRQARGPEIRPPAEHARLAEAADHLSVPACGLDARIDRQPGAGRGRETFSGALPENLAEADRKRAAAR